MVLIRHRHAVMRALPCGEVRKPSSSDWRFQPNPPFVLSLRTIFGPPFSRCAWASERGASYVRFGSVLNLVTGKGHLPFGRSSLGRCDLGASTPGGFLWLA